MAARKLSLALVLTVASRGGAQSLGDCSVSALNGTSPVGADGRFVENIPGMEH